MTISAIRIGAPATLDSLRTLVERVRAAKQQQTNQQLLASLGRARRPGP